MARPKEFESEAALNEAIDLFSKHGFEGTSTDELMRVMRISRQSMYDTFGDKRQLYLASLQHYTARSVSNQIQGLSSAQSAVKGLEAVLDLAVSQAIDDKEPKCLGISAICEFGRSEPDITIIYDMASKTLLSAFERRISEAKSCAEIDKGVNVQIAAQFMMATLTGIRVAARAGASPDSLRGITRMAMRALK